MPDTIWTIIIIEFELFAVRRVSRKCWRTHSDRSGWPSSWSGSEFRGPDITHVDFKLPSIWLKQVDPAAGKQMLLRNTRQWRIQSWRGTGMPPPMQMQLPLLLPLRAMLKLPVPLDMEQLIRVVQMDKSVGHHWRCSICLALGRCSRINSPGWAAIDSRAPLTTSSLSSSSSRLIGSG